MRGDIMRPLDVGHRFGVKIQPHFAKDRVPSPSQSVDETTTRIQTARWLILLFITAFLDYRAAAISIASWIRSVTWEGKELGSAIDYRAFIQEKVAQLVSINEPSRVGVQVQINPAARDQVSPCVL